MRQKYKIWNNTKKEWYKPIYDAINGKIDDITLTPSGEFIRRTIDITIHESAFTEEFIMVPYIGINDKDNNPIYYGDVLLTNRGEYIFPKEYNNNKYGIHSDIDHDNVNDLVYCILFSEDHSGINGWERKELKIIGNIYEDNLLLK